MTHRCFASLPRATAGQDNNTERLQRIRRGSSLTGSAPGVCNDVGHQSWETKLLNPRARRSLDDRCTVAQIGGFLFVYSRALGAVKLGTGFEGTLQSHVYARNDSFPDFTGITGVSDGDTTDPNTSSTETKGQTGPPLESKESKDSHAHHRGSKGRHSNVASSASDFEAGDLFVVGGQLYFHSANSENSEDFGNTCRSGHFVT